MANPDVIQTAEIYETLSSLNLAFAGIVQHLKTMQQSRILSTKYMRLFSGFTQELQAEINIEFLEALDRIEDSDWTRFGKVRHKKSHFQCKIH